MTRNAREIEREGGLSDMETLRAEQRELHAELERLKAERDEWKAKWLALAQASLILTEDREP